MALWSGTTNPTKLGGIIGLSCYLPLRNKFKTSIPEGNPNKDTPIFMCHGDSDPLVRPQWGQMSAELLTSNGYNVKFKLYP